MTDTSARGTLTPPPRQRPRRTVPPTVAARAAAPTVAPPRRAPVTQPPVTQPPVTQPPSQAPRTHAPVTHAPVTQPAGTRAPAREPQAPPRPRRMSVPARARAANRMPFIILLCGLLGGALVSALVISTTLAEGAFQITNLQQSDSALAKQQQQLEEEVATAQSAQVIEQRAYELGMRPSQLQFLNLKAGKIQSSATSSSAGGDTP
ncbi:MAG TPA: hypothetical protein VK817_20095 [Trebonia sp.]|jgi:hypothetical protein|nr:hypothetical protein [Trebonia sp.]